MLRFRRPREAARARDGSGEAVPVIALTGTEIVAGSLRAEGDRVRDLIATASPVVVEEAVVLRLD
ncbi:MAG TPA: hypothetical protein VFR93_08920, partial [Candidatus Limnocylindrales bacterium]|nr:hypothetical protein [Candidatus Limnocylindrales bacterium]